MKFISTKEPRKLSMMFTAVSGVTLGMLLGVSILFGQPPKTVSASAGETAEPQDRLGDYTQRYTPGVAAADLSADFKRDLNKIRRRTQGKVTFTSGELNAFVDEIAGDLKRRPAAEGETAAAKQDTHVGVPRFRMIDDKLFASVKATTGMTGSPFEVTAVAEIYFENYESGPELRVRSASLNSMPATFLASMWSGLVEKALGELVWPSETLDMWQNIRGIEVVDGQLVVDVGMRRPKM